jgi:ketosteroid isomerase-like protein
MLTAEARLLGAYDLWRESCGECVDQWLDLITEDFAFGSLAEGKGVEFAKSGQDATDFAAHLRGLIGDWEMRFFSVDTLVSERNRVAVLCRSTWQNRRTGRLVAGPLAQIWRFCGERAVGLVAFTDTAQWLAAANGRTTAVDGGTPPKPALTVTDDAPSIDAATRTRLRSVYRRWIASGGTDPDPWLELMADEFHVRTLSNGAGGVEFSRACFCKADLSAYFIGLMGDWDMLDYRVDEVITEGDKILVLLHSTWRNVRTGKLVEGPALDAWRFKDGRAVEKFEFSNSAAWIAAATADPPPG